MYKKKCFKNINVSSRSINVESGLGILSPVFRANRLFLLFGERKSESVIHSFWGESLSCAFLKSDVCKLLTLALCLERPERFAHRPSFKKEPLSEEQREWFAVWNKKGENCQKHTKIPILFQKNLSESLVFESDKRDSLTVALLSWATWAKRSQSLFNLSDFERKSEEEMSEFPTLSGVTRGWQQKISPEF